ncbi:MAG: hypothetical protein PHS54_07355 [Clostridia bacterium]|nr:hypothetical protein [Clostridia bacterium]
MKERKKIYDVIPPSKEALIEKLKHYSGVNEYVAMAYEIDKENSSAMIEAPVKILGIDGAIIRYYDDKNNLQNIDINDVGYIYETDFKEGSQVETDPKIYYERACNIIGTLEKSQRKDFLIRLKDKGDKMLFAHIDTKKYTNTDYYDAYMVFEYNGDIQTLTDDTDSDILVLKRSILDNMRNEWKHLTEKTCMRINKNDITYWEPAPGDLLSELNTIFAAKGYDIDEILK